MTIDATLLKFIVEHKLETRLEDDECLLWLPYYLADDFVSLFKPYFETEICFKAVMQEDGLCIDMEELFNGDIDLDELLK